MSVHGGVFNERIEKVEVKTRLKCLVISIQGAAGPPWVFELEAGNDLIFGKGA